MLFDEGQVIIAGIESKSGGMCHHHNCIRPHQFGVSQLCHHIAYRHISVGRVNQYYTVLLIQEGDCLGDAAAINMRLFRKARLFQITFYYSTTLRCSFNKVDQLAPRLSASMPSCPLPKQVKHLCPIVRDIFQNGENSPFDQISSGTGYGSSGGFKLMPLRLSGNYSHAQYEIIS